MKQLGFKAVLVTRGSSGMDLFESERRKIRRTHIPALQRHEVFDVTGQCHRRSGLTMALRLACRCRGSEDRECRCRIVVGMVDREQNRTRWPE